MPLSRGLWSWVKQMHPTDLYTISSVDKLAPGTSRRTAYVTALNESLRSSSQHDLVQESVSRERVPSIWVSPGLGMQSGVEGGREVQCKNQENPGQTGTSWPSKHLQET